MTEAEKANIKDRLSNIGEKVGELALKYISELEKENAALKAQIKSPCTSCCITESLEQSLDEMNYQIANQDAEIRQLKEQIEKMKCCGNCTNRGLEKYIVYPCSECKRWHREKTNDKWESAE